MYLLLNRHRVCPPRLITCPCLFAYFSLGGSGAGRNVSWGNIFSTLHLCSFRNVLHQKNVILKRMILTCLLAVTKLFAPSPLF